MAKRQMDIRPIRTDADYEWGLQEIERLMDAKAGSSDGDRLDVLATLVSAYEAQHFPMERPDPIAAIEFRMEQRGMTRKDLEKALGGKSRVSEVLNRRRALTVSMIRSHRRVRAAESWWRAQRISARPRATSRMTRSPRCMHKGIWLPCSTISRSA
jgi:HTH-type transcriptional regulator / antitoxin HigA